jgi:hypothetical protein
MSVCGVGVCVLFCTSLHITLASLLHTSFCARFLRALDGGLIICATSAKRAK